MYSLVGSRLYLRSMEASTKDAYFVAKIRNTSEARNSFFCKDVVTPDSHIKFLNSKSPYNLVFMICLKQVHSPIGIIGLIVDPKNHIAEYGRIVIDQELKRRGYATEATYTILSFAFEFLNLTSLWLEVLLSNEIGINFYKKMGWTEQTPRIDLNSKPVVIMTYSSDKWKETKNTLSKEFINIRDSHEVILEK